MLEDVHSRVQEGTTLADAMARHPRAFGELATSIVRAGGEGGFLEEALDRLAKFTEQQDELKSKVIGALAYPTILFVLGHDRRQRADHFLRAEVRATVRHACANGANCRSSPIGCLWLSHTMQSYGIFIVAGAVRRWAGYLATGCKPKKAACGSTAAAESAGRQRHLSEPGRVAVLPRARHAARRRRADRALARNQRRLDGQPRAVGRRSRGGREHFGRPVARRAARKPAAIFRPTSSK